VSAVIEGPKLVLEGREDEGNVVLEFAEALARGPAAAERINEAWAKAYLDRGSALLKQRRDEEATAAFAKALARDPAAAKRIDQAWAPRDNDKAWNLVSAGTAADGLNDAENAVALAHGDANILDARAQIYLALGRIDEALVDFDKAIEPGIKGPWSYFGRGQS